nr:hypothetical protein Iba_chr03eCG11380 [Ipomoea batatas]
MDYKLKLSHGEREKGDEEDRFLGNSRSARSSDLYRNFMLSVFDSFDISYPKASDSLLPFPFLPSFSPHNYIAREPIQENCKAKGYFGPGRTKMKYVPKSGFCSPPHHSLTLEIVSNTP